MIPSAPPQFKTQLETEIADLCIKKFKEFDEETELKIDKDGCHQSAIVNNNRTICGHTPFYSNQLCKACYQQQYYFENKKEINQKRKHRIQKFKLAISQKNKNTLNISSTIEKLSKKIKKSNKKLHRN